MSLEDNKRLVRRLSVTVVNIDRVVDARIVEHSGAANLLHPLLEAGAIRPCEDV